MSLRNAFGIYQAIEKVLRASKTPLTCNDLFEFEEIRHHAEDVNKVSDYLGHMYRRSKELPSAKQFISRERAPAGSGGARWAYYWKNPSLGTPRVPVSRQAQPKLSVVDLPALERRQQHVASIATTLAETASVRVQQADGEIIIETLHHVIIIRNR